MKNRSLLPWKLILLAATAAILLLVGCNTVKGEEGFAVYLTREDIPPAKMPMQSYVDIAEQPVFASKDIISYDSGKHEIILTPAAFEKISALQVPLSGRSFVVCVDKKPIYSGAFWTPISSMSYDGVIIMKPLAARERATSIKIELGYPSHFTGDDPRNNAEVMASLRQAGKLK